MLFASPNSKVPSCSLPPSAAESPKFTSSSGIDLSVRPSPSNRTWFTSTAWVCMNMTWPRRATSRFSESTTTLRVVLATHTDRSARGGTWSSSSGRSRVTVPPSIAAIVRTSSLVGPWVPVTTIWSPTSHPTSSPASRSVVAPAGTNSTSVVRCVVSAPYMTVVPWRIAPRPSCSGSTERSMGPSSRKRIRALTPSSIGRSFVPTSTRPAGEDTRVSTSSWVSTSGATRRVPNTPTVSIRVCRTVSTVTVRPSGITTLALSPGTWPPQVAGSLQPPSATAV